MEQFIIRLLAQCWALVHYKTSIFGMQVDTFCLLKLNFLSVHPALFVVDLLGASFWGNIKCTLEFKKP